MSLVKCWGGPGPSAMVRPRRRDSPLTTGPAKRGSRSQRASHCAVYLRARMRSRRDLARIDRNIAGRGWLRASLIGAVPSLL